MTVIQIKEQSSDHDGFDVVVIIDNVIMGEVHITPPFNSNEEKSLEWYFEEYTHFPYIDQSKAKEISAKIINYGELLFEQIFHHNNLNSYYKKYLSNNLSNIKFVIEGSPSFNGLAWETLKDPALTLPIAFSSQIVRSPLKSKIALQQLDPIQINSKINILIVTARVNLINDINPRTISQPLVEMVEQENLQVNINILRPATYKSLKEHLQSINEKYGKNYYHIIHFDVHGALLTYEEYYLRVDANYFIKPDSNIRIPIVEFEGVKPFIFLEADRDGQMDAVVAEELANLLYNYNIPIVILNACQSSKQIGKEETSLGSILVNSGIQIVLGMKYSITVKAVVILMKTLYQQILSGVSLSTAMVFARYSLYQEKLRISYFDENIKLEDWLLPIVYENQDIIFSPTNILSEKNQTEFEKNPEKVYFVGRDIDIVSIEKAILINQGEQNIIPVIGMVGTGKTTLLKYLSLWWEKTNFIINSCIFNFEEENLTYQQIVAKVKNMLVLKNNENRLSGSPVSEASVVEILRSARYLLVFDDLQTLNLTLPKNDQKKLIDFFISLLGGKTVILIGTCTTNDLLFKRLSINIGYKIMELDFESISNYSKNILTQIQRMEYFHHRELFHLINLADGNPLALKIFLNYASNYSPQQLIHTLTNNTGLLCQTMVSDLQPFNKIYQRLSQNTKNVLTVLTPFRKTFYTNYLSEYITELKNHGITFDLSIENWESAFRELECYGFFEVYWTSPLNFRIHPILPLFLQIQHQKEILSKIDDAFCEYYQNFSGGLVDTLSRNRDNMKVWDFVLKIIESEIENLLRALNISVNNNRTIDFLFSAISEYWHQTKYHEQLIELGKEILERLKSSEKANLLSMINIINEIGRHYISLNKFIQAENIFNEAIELINQAEDWNDKEKDVWKSGILSNLAKAYRMRGEQTKAEEYYKKSSRELNDDLEQAGVYLDLGIVAREQKRLNEAKRYYYKAYKIAKRLKNNKLLGKIFHEAGFLCQEKGKLKLAENFYEKSIRLKVNDDSSLALTLCNRSSVYLMQEKYELAYTDLKRVLKVGLLNNNYSIQIRALNGLGNVMYTQKQWKQAFDYYYKALAISKKTNDNQNLYMTLANLGVLWMESKLPNLLDDIASLLKTSKQILEEMFSNFNNPKEDRFEKVRSMSKLMEESECLYLENKFTEAIEVLNKVIQLYPDNVVAYYNRSLAKKSIGDINGAIEDITKVINQQPDDARAFFDRGNLYQTLDNNTKAMEDYNEAIKLEPNEADYYSNRGFINYKLENYVDAIQDFEVALRLNPFDVFAHFYHGNINKANGNLNKAIEDYSEAINCFSKLQELQYEKHIDKDNELVKKVISEQYEFIIISSYLERAHIKSIQGEFDGANKDLNYLIENYPSDSVSLAYSNRGNLRLQKGDIDGSISDLKTAINLNPNNISAYYDLACGYSIANKIELSLSALEKALELNNKFVFDIVYDDDDLDLTRRDNRFQELMGKYK